MLSYKAPAGKMLFIYKYCKVVRVLESRYGLVRRVIVEYRIPSLKQKQVCVDIRRLVILPNISIYVQFCTLMMWSLCQAQLGI